jgi:hypothetical protein
MRSIRGRDRTVTRRGRGRATGRLVVPIARDRLDKFFTFDNFILGVFVSALCAKGPSRRNVYYEQLAFSL